MKKLNNHKSKILTALSLTLFLASCQNINGTKTASNHVSATNDESATIISTYKGGQVTLKEVNQELKKLVAKNPKLSGITFDNLNFEQKSTIIKEIVLNEMAYEEAKKRDLDKDKDYQEALKNFESEILKQKLIISLAKDASDEERIKKTYDELATKLKDKNELRISYIAVKTKDEAEKIYQAITKSPSTFSDQAKKKSVDKEIAKKGGDLGFVVEDALPADIVKKAESLQKEQISKPFLTNKKWVIIKLVDKRPAEIPSYEKAKDALIKNLTKKAIEDFASQSFEKAQINILVK